jgi:hypothetical protein
VVPDARKPINAHAERGRNDPGVPGAFTNVSWSREEGDLPCRTDG